jgi:hypothetical protein
MVLVRVQKSGNIEMKEMSGNTKHIPNAMVTRHLNLEVKIKIRASDGEEPLLFNR